MKMSFANKPTRGQTSLEYLLLLAVVAVVVIASFSPGSLIDQIHNAAGSYYNTVTRVIMGETPQAIPGGWCPVTCPPSGSYGPTVMYQACECPAPAFGGAYCQGSGAVTCTGVQSCSCPTGQACGAVPSTTANPSGCGCSNGMSCDSLQGSFPDPTCTKCVCPNGGYYDQERHACVNYCSNPCTTYNGSGCSLVTCGTNQTCDPTQPPSSECACNKYAYFNGTACAYCPSDGSHCTAVNSTGTGCVDITCPTNENCNTGSNQCQCNAGTHWQGNGCVSGACTSSSSGTCTQTPGQPSGSCTATLSCPTVANGIPDPNGCGQDGCGGNCGANQGKCPSGQQCNGSNGGPGTCGCSPTEVWNGSKCVPLTPCGSNTCGYDSDGNACGSNGGSCSSGEPCSSSNGNPVTSTTLPGLCCLSCQTLQNGACVNTTPCGNNNCGADSCGNSCGRCGGGQCGSTNTPGICTCPPGQTLDACGNCGGNVKVVTCNAGTDSCGYPCTAT